MCSCSKQSDTGLPRGRVGRSLDVGLKNLMIRPGHATLGTIGENWRLPNAQNSPTICLLYG